MHAKSWSGSFFLSSFQRVALGLLAADTAVCITLRCATTWKEALSCSSRTSIAWCDTSLVPAYLTLPSYISHAVHFIWFIELRHGVLWALANPYLLASFLLAAAFWQLCESCLCWLFLLLLLLLLAVPGRTIIALGVPATAAWCDVHWLIASRLLVIFLSTCAFWFDAEDRFSFLRISSPSPPFLFSPPSSRPWGQDTFYRLYRLFIVFIHPFIHSIIHSLLGGPLLCRASLKHPSR